MVDQLDELKPLKVEDILGEEDFQLLKRVDEVGESLREMIRRSEEAGIDVSELKSRLENSLKKAKGIRQAFFPGR